MTRYVDHPSSRAGAGTLPRPSRGRKSPACHDLRSHPRAPGQFGPLSTGSARTGAWRPRTDVGALSARLDALVELTSRALEEFAKAYSHTAARSGGDERLHAPSVEGGEVNGSERGESGALTHLRSMPDGSLGAVFSPELAGGLDPAEFGPFIAEAFRVLRPGGMLVAENRGAGLDPVEVHRLGCADQVLPETAVLLCRQAGFPEATVVFHGGRSDRCPDASSCTDYAVVAVR